MIYRLLGMSLIIRSHVPLTATKCCFLCFKLRKYIVMEKEKEYYNKGLKRILEWEREQKTKLF